jgi:hypothetical protein
MRSKWLVVLGCAIVLGASPGTLRAEEPTVLEGDAGPDTQDKAQAEQKLNEAWGQLTLEDKMALMRFHRVMSDLPPEQRKIIRDRIGRIMSMTPEQRQRLEQNLKRWQQMTPQERQHAREVFRRRRQALEEKWRREHPGQEPP